jgi:hypothetical protein
MAGPHSVDELAPEARFALRAAAAGLPIDDAAAVMRLDGATARKHLRTAVRALGTAAPPPSEGDAALLAAAAPLFPAARAAPNRAPAKPCPAADVAAALAAGALDGPLMLAEMEHAADCPACLARLVALRARGAPPAAAPPRPARRVHLPALLAVTAVIAALAWWILLR